MDMVIKNGTIVLENEEIIGDILVENGKIAAIGSDLGNAHEIIDATGLLVAPGMVDAHVHLSEPGRSDWEGYETGTKSAIRGGVTTIIEMPLNQLPATVNGQALERKVEASKGKLFCDVALLGGLIPGNEKGIMELHNSGVVGFKAFMATCGDPNEPSDFRHVDDFELLMGMKTIAKTGKVLGVHAENAVICDQLGKQYKAQGKGSAQDYTSSRPHYSEVEAIRRLLYLAQIANCPIHVCHVSSAEGLKEIEKAKKAGQKVTAETCPHYLLLDTQDVQTIGTLGKCSPPIREKENQEELWNAIKRGEIDVIASDHSPCLPEMKKGNFFDAWGGISGLQSTVELLVHEAITKRDIPSWKLFQLLSANPAKIFGLRNKGSISIGKDADLDLINPHKAYTLSEDDLQYRHKVSPYLGYSIGSCVISTILRGEKVYQKESGFTKKGKLMI